jgi:hypothetical protein
MWWFLNNTGFLFAFKHRYGNFNHTRVLFQMGEGYAAIQMAGGLPVVEGGGSLMTRIAGSATTQTISFKYVRLLSHTPDI